jgi:hypothetical protein
MIKKYEIITVEGKKRIKALRSFRVQDRFVNIGDVGGIVYDENTLSQEGNAWIFSGNLGYASIRVGGDSIVDTNGYEGAVTDPRPLVSITGTSALIGAHNFVTGESSATKTLAASDMEVGGALVVVGKTYEESKEVDPTVLRMKATLYRGGTKTTVKATSPDYQIKVLRYDVNGLLFSASPNWVTGGPDTSVTTEDCYYYAVIVRKTAGGTIGVADITTAAVTVSNPVTESTLNINDSRVEFRYTSAMTVATALSLGVASSGVRKSVIDKSNVVISKAGGAAFNAYIYADITQCNVAFTTDSAKSALAGTFENVKNLTYNGSFLDEYSLKLRKNLIVSGCDNFALSTRTLAALGVDAANAANMPFIFIRCNVPGGRIYHNAEIKNTYTDIDFAKASVDLRKTISGTAYELASSEVEGMYRIYDTVNNTYGCLVEAYDSVAGLTSTGADSYNTTIYKDAKLTGPFNISGTNVFGGTGNHGGGKGCEITNTKETEMVISGNVRVEGNAKVKDTRITGTGYFGGNSVTENAYIFGSAYVTDNGVFSPTPEEGKFDSDIHIEDNAKFLATSRAGNTVVYMCGDSEFSGTIAFNTLSLAMYGKSRIAGKVSGRGVLILEDNADTSDKNVGAYGCIRLVGNYRQTKEKIWTGRRTISSENEPTYDNNVKTKYDF